MEKILISNSSSLPQHDQFHIDVLTSLFNNYNFERPLLEKIKYLDVHCELHIYGSALSIQNQRELLELL